MLNPSVWYNSTSHPEEARAQLKPPVWHAAKFADTLARTGDILPDFLLVLTRFFHQLAAFEYKGSKNYHRKLFILSECFNYWLVCNYLSGWFKEPPLNCAAACGHLSRRESPLETLNTWWRSTLNTWHSVLGTCHFKHLTLGTQHLLNTLDSTLTQHSTFYAQLVNTQHFCILTLDTQCSTFDIEYSALYTQHLVLNNLPAKEVCCSQNMFGGGGKGDSFAVAHRLIC